MSRFDAESLHHITRCDYQRAHVYWVRFEQRRKAYVSRFFSDSLHGGRLGAMSVAIDYRNAIKPRMPIRRAVFGPGRIWKELRSYRDARGVRHYYRAWVAWINLGDRMASSNWSIDKHGNAEAKRQIVAWLERMRKVQARNLKRRGSKRNGRSFRP